MTDTDDDGNVSVDMRGVYDLSVKGINDDGNSAVVIGDEIYYVVGDTPVLSKKKSGVFFGYALEAVVSGATTTIEVLQSDSTVNIGAAAVTTAMLEDNAATSAKLAEDTIQTATIEVSAAEIKAINAAPKTLVAAQGAGTYIEFISAVMFLDYGSAAYANNGILGVYETNSDGTVVSDTVALNDFLAKTADTVKFVPPVAADYSMTANVPLVLTMATGESITGDSPVTVHITYRVHDFS